MLQRIRVQQIIPGNCKGVYVIKCVKLIANTNLREMGSRLLGLLEIKILNCKEIYQTNQYYKPKNEC